MLFVNATNMGYNVLYLKRRKSMKIKVTVKTDLNKNVHEREVEEGTSLESLLNEFRSELPFRILVARVDNVEEELSYVINNPCTIEFLDMRTPMAKMVYQRSLTLIYLKAIWDVLGEDAETNIYYSLSKGLYTEINGGIELSDEIITRIEKRMWEIVDEDLPITKLIVTKQEAIRLLDKYGWEEKSELLEYADNVHYIAFYELDGYRNYFYGHLVPSTRYIDKLDLRRYKGGVILRYPHPNDPNALPAFYEDGKLYDAFNDAKNLGMTLGVSYIKDLNKVIMDGNEKRLIELTEELHDTKIRNIASMIDYMEKRIILIAGPSSSGKTTFAKRLSMELKELGHDPLYMGTDDYFVERTETPLDENGEYDFENLDAMDVDLFNDNINSLLAGKEVDLPTFNFLTGHKEFGKRLTKLKPGQAIIIEGIHALNGEMSKHISENEKFKVYISPLTQLNMDDHNRIHITDVRLLRRMIRDNRTRGNSVKSTINVWPKVRRGEDKNIFPYNGEADVLFNSAHLYELPVIKNHVEPLLREVTRDDNEYADAIRLLDFLSFFLHGTPSSSRSVTLRETPARLSDFSSDAPGALSDLTV